MLEHIFQFNTYVRNQFVACWAKALPPGSRVLDVGAGTCRYRSLFSHCHYKAQDFAQHKPVTTGPMREIDFAYGQLDFISDAARIPVPDQSFDAVLCTEVLEHVAEPILVINEIARVLQPGGRVLLTAPLCSGIHQAPDHYYGGYTPYWYVKFLQEAGLDQIQIETNGGFFKYYGQESRRFSALIDPRRVRGAAKILLAPIWLISLPYFRILVPLFCHVLDPLDNDRAFTVGYHVLARKKAKC
jgi:SAM-dependent methyltransferase